MQLSHKRVKYRYKLNQKKQQNGQHLIIIYEKEQLICLKIIITQRQIQKKLNMYL